MKKLLTLALIASAGLLTTTSSASAIGVIGPNIYYRAKVCTYLNQRIDDNITKRVENHCDGVIWEGNDVICGQLAREYFELLLQLRQNNCSRVAHNPYSD
jgi:hypothetical protein